MTSQLVLSKSKVMSGKAKRPRVQTVQKISRSGKSRVIVQLKEPGEIYWPEQLKRMWREAGIQ